MIPADPRLPRDWWEGVPRETFQATADREAPRMSASKIGQWLETTTGLGSPLRSRKMATGVPTVQGGDA